MSDYWISSRICDIVAAVNRERDAEMRELRALIRELLAALESIAIGADAERQWPDNPCGPAWEDIFTIAIAAIAKAKGETE